MLLSLVLFWLSIIFLWKSQLIATQQNLNKNTIQTFEHLNLLALNSKSYFSIKAKIKCESKENRFNLKATVYLNDGSNETLSSQNECVNGIQTLGLFSNGKIKAFQSINKITLMSSAELSNYEITWHNAKP